MSDLALTNAIWRKSTRSDGGGNECVEIAFAPGATGLRDSKKPDGGMLVLPPTGWTAFRSTLTAR